MAAPFSSESRRAVQRRDSSTSTGTKRPRLLRASATEPSITTSNASRGALANPQSSRRATDLLNQVAFISGSPPDSSYRVSSSSSRQSTMYGSIGTTEALSSSPTTTSDDLDELRSHHYSGRYFSFPSFDTWDGPQEKDEEDIKSI